MARSTYIYVVQGEMDGGVQAAFTVKHQLVTWLKRQPPHELSWLSVLRVADGGHASKAPAYIEMGDLIGD